MGDERRLQEVRERQESYRQYNELLKKNHGAYSESFADIEFLLSALKAERDNRNDWFHLQQTFERQLNEYIDKVKRRDKRIKELEEENEQIKLLERKCERLKEQLDAVVNWFNNDAETFDGLFQILKDRFKKNR